MSWAARTRRFALGLAVVTPAALGLWAVGQLLLGFGPGTACTTDPDCGSGTTSCGVCRPVVVATSTWTGVQIALALGLAVWIGSRAVPSPALAPALAWHLAASAVLWVVILVAEQAALDV